VFGGKCVLIVVINSDLGSDVSRLTNNQIILDEV